MRGSATFTMVASITTMRTPTDVSISVSQCRRSSTSAGGSAAAGVSFKAHTKQSGHLGHSLGVARRQSRNQYSSLPVSL
jgi:hypothetical protein